MDQSSNKTNATWYPYKEMGSFFRIENGVLVGCPMNSDGTRDDTPFDVDWERGVEEKDEKKMKEVVNELQIKD